MLNKREWQAAYSSCWSAAHAVCFAAAGTAGCEALTLVTSCCEAVKLGARLGWNLLWQVLQPKALKAHIRIKPLQCTYALCEKHPAPVAAGINLFLGPLSCSLGGTSSALHGCLLFEALLQVVGICNLAPAVGNCDKAIHSCDRQTEWESCAAAMVCMFRCTAHAEGMLTCPASCASALACQYGERTLPQRLDVCGVQ